MSLSLWKEDTMSHSTCSTTPTLLQKTRETGTIAGVATTVTAVLCGMIEENKPLAPLNAVSHIVWGETAAHQDNLSAKFTATGLALNTIAVTLWAGVFEWIQSRAVEKPDLTQSLINGAAVSGLAFMTDYYLVPKRLTPGFEKRLSNASLLAIYSTLALDLALGSRCRTSARSH